LDVRIEIPPDRWEETLTEFVVDEVVEGVAVAVVGELVVGGRELLEALERDCVKVAAEFGVLGENHCAARHERIDQRSLVLVLPHLLLLLPDLCLNLIFGLCVKCVLLFTCTPFFFFSFLFLSFLF